MPIPINPDWNFLHPLIWLPVLYAETHYRFGWLPGRIHQSEPEIIADCPSRIKQGDLLPVLIIVKDANLYPVCLAEIAVYSGSDLLYHQSPALDLHSRYEEHILEVPTAGLAEGIVPLNVRITYRTGSTIKICWNDNHRGSSHAPLPLYVSSESLPRLNGCLFGESHAHTVYTSDQVEFGASLPATARLAEAMGLDFFCATDHSYDLDDLPDHYLINDPSLAKWNLFLQEAENFNSQHTFRIIPGEEVTVRNSRNKNVHCLVYNSRRFFPGSGDGAEKWLRTHSELSITDLLRSLPEGACAFAAHPAEKPPFLQRLLLNRGTWRRQDCRAEHLSGMQFINHSGAAIDKQGKQLWIAMLLNGKRMIGLAGNDAHGNFSRFRQIGIPTLTMRENYLHLFGHWRTGVYVSGEKKDTASVLKAIRQGACFMTNGPALSLTAYDRQACRQHTGNRLENIGRIKVAARSSREFSALKSVTISGGFSGEKREYTVFRQEAAAQQFEYNLEIDFLPQRRNGYIRAEITTQSGRSALSNPIWF
jgi:hypothetical protein